MAGGDSNVKICNRALIAIGEDPITSLSDNRKAAILCSQLYDPERQATLRAHPWNCARQRVQLDADTAAPAFGFSAQYTLPADFIRMSDMPENTGAKWMIEGGKLLTDEGAPLSIVYIKDLTDATVFDPLMVKALVLSLAVELCQPLKQSSELQDRLGARLEATLRIARLSGAQENAPVEWDTDIWLRERG